MVIKESITEGRDPIASIYTIDSLRSQGFHYESAICEIIDNSIEANAKNIRINFKWGELKPGQRDQRINKFIFTDDGDGMDKTNLFDCLVLGESTRRANRNGIGKFGVGATFSGISQGKKIEVYSKIKGGSWLYTWLDLDLLEQGIGIPDPIKKSPPTEHSVENGTIVIWDNLDKSDLIKNSNKILQLTNNVGRIYRKFLAPKKIQGDKIVDNDPIKIFMDGELIEPYDPLFLTYNRKKDDVEIPTFEYRDVPIMKNGIKSKMRITISKFPSSWWDSTGAGNTDVNVKQRFITDRNEGVSIVRAGRETLFGDIPYFRIGSGASKKHFTEIDRWTGIEISFERDADDIFGVESNKARLLISSYISEEISNYISSTIVQRRGEIDEIRGLKREEEGDAGATSFAKSKKRIQDQTKQQYGDDEKNELKKIVKGLEQNIEKQQELYVDLEKGYHPELSYNLDSNGAFVSYMYHLKSITVKYNMNHPFMKKFFDTLDDIAKQQGKNPNSAINVKEIESLKMLFDVLMASFGLARERFGDTKIEQEIQSTINTLIVNWGDITHHHTKN